MDNMFLQIIYTHMLQNLLDWNNLYCCAFYRIDIFVTAARSTEF